MAKLDDFGRPIYETAEEYNKAHKGGVCPRPYDSPEGENYQHNTGNSTKSYKTVAQRHATVQGSKKAMKTVAAIGIVILFLNIGAILTLVGNVVDEEFMQSEESVDSYEMIGNADTPLPVGYEMFYYNGAFYKLPMKCEDILQMGYVSYVYSETEGIPPEYEEITTLYDEDSGMQIEIRFSNNTEYEIPFEECVVDYLLMENPALYDEIEVIPDVFFGTAEFSFESSYEEIEAYLGDPYWYYHEGTDEYTYDIYQWMYYPEENASDEYIQFVEVKFFDDVIESIHIEKTEYEEKY